MSRLHHEEEAQVSFHDASAYFSEEEWKLLQEWQKELYRNVMKEIHQALVSLGPLIVTTVCSLRAKDQDEMHPIDDPHSERKGRIHHFPSAVMADPDGPFKVTREEPFRLHNPQYSDGSKQNDVASTEFPALNTGIGLRREEPLPMFRKAGTAPSPDYEVVSFHIKDEEEAYCMDLQQSTSAGDKSMKRRKKAGDLAHRLEISALCKADSGKINKVDPQSSNKEANSRRQTWSNCYQDSRGEDTVQYEGRFSNAVPFNVHQGSPHTVQRSDAFSECESNLRKSQLPKDLPSLGQSQESYICTEGENIYGYEDALNHSRERPYACTECEKSFFHKSHLITHNRIHSGEKPYYCTFCHKRFNRKDYLDEHIRIHTGERPYRCTKCGKSFIRKCHLNDHQRKHACSSMSKTNI